MNHLSSVPGNNLDVIFDNYSYKDSAPSKERDFSQMERVMNSLNQDPSPIKEWNEFLMNYKNKLQIVNLLVDYINQVEFVIRLLLSTKDLSVFIQSMAMAVFTFQNLIFCTGRLIRKFSWTLFMLAEKTIIQFVWLLMIWIYI